MNPRLLACCLLLPLLHACGAPPPPPPQPARTVRVFTVGADPSRGARDYSGEVRARHETVLAFRLAGRISQRLVDAGAPVGAGQVLARLDPADVTLLAADAEARRAQAEAELQRHRELRTRNFISQSALESRETAYQAALAQAGLARNQVSYATLAAERAGTVAAVLAEEGQVVAAGQPVIRLAPDGDREVALALPEADAAELKVGDTAEVTLWAQEGRRLVGRLREIAAAADPASRTYAARVALPEAEPRLPVGLSASVRFPRPAAPDQLVVPTTALFQKDQGFAVWKLDEEGALTLVPVSVLRYADLGAVIGGGLAAGDRIVAAGGHRLAEGEKVKVAPTAPGAADGQRP